MTLCREVVLCLSSPMLARAEDYTQPDVVALNSNCVSTVLGLRISFSTVKWVEGSLLTFVGKMNCPGEQWIPLCWKYSIHDRILNNLT